MSDDGLEPGSAGRHAGGAEDTDLELVREALDGLRAEIRSRLHPEASRPSIDWLALFDELRRRLGALGMVERSGEVDEFGLDEVVLRRATLLLDFLQDRYWRVDVHGLDRVPEPGPCLLVGNRSGLLPYDGLMISHVLSRARPQAPRPRFLVADWLVTLPFVQPFLARIGGVRASRENAERLLGSDRSVVAFPEGVKGAAKVYRERYRLKRFGRGGVVRLALSVGCPLVPVAVVGAEEAHPVLFKMELLGRNLGLPFVPVTPTFPLLGPAGLVPLPSKWSIRFGEPLALQEFGPAAADDELLISRLTEELRSTIQNMVEAGVAERPSIWG